MSTKVNRWLTEDGLVVIQGWARWGLSVEQIAENMNVSKSALYNWIKKYPEIEKAVYSGKEVADFHVENAIYKSACGFFEDELKVESTGQAKKTKRYYPPNPALGIFWLTNRQPQRWKNFRRNEDETKEIEKLDSALDKIYRELERRKEEDS